MPRHETLVPLIDSLARHGEHPAVVGFTRERANHLTFNELARLVQSFARGVHALGDEAGESVAMLAENRAESFAACLGVMRAGRAVVPIDVQHTQEALGQILRDSDARVILTTGPRVEQIEALQLDRPPRIVLLDADRGEERSWLRLFRDDGELPSIDADTPATLFYTSGTTGPPKGVPLTHGNLAFQVDAVIEVKLLLQDDRLLVPLPLHHVYPFVIGMLVPLSLGRAVVLPHALTGPQLARALLEGEATVVLGVPKLYRALYSGVESQAQAAGPIAREIFHRSLNASVWLRNRLGLRAGKFLLRPVHKRFGSQLRLLASGGSPLDADLAQKLEGFGWQIAIGYGLTETSPLLTIKSPGGGRLDTVGKPIPGVELRIDPIERDEESGAAPRGREHEDAGEVVARGPGVFRGYRNLPDKTRQAFTPDGWFRTGDMGYFDDDGYLHLLGRASTMIVSEAGENIAPENVEDAYAADPAIEEVGVLQIEGKLVGVVVPAGEHDEHEIRNAIQSRGGSLPSYQRLSDIRISRRKLDRTRLGKLQRHTLEERYKQLEKGESDASAAQAGPMPVEQMSGEDRALLQSPLARQVWDFLAERFEKQPLTPDAHLQTDLGVDSIEWLNLTLDVAQRAGVEIGEDVIAEVQTVRDLLREVSQQTARMGEGAISPLDEPERALGEEQLQWLRPRTRGQAVAGILLYALIWALAKPMFRVRPQGLLTLPRRGNYVIASNHASYIDPFAIATALGRRRLARTYWAGWTGVAFTGGLTRWFSRVAQIVPVDPRRGVLSSLAFAAAVLRRGHNLVWFPEGERSETGELQEFKPGIGMVLEKHPTLVVPTCVHGSHAAMPPGKFLPRPHRVTVTFGEPVDSRQLEREGDADGAPQRIAEALRRRVAALQRRAAPRREADFTLPREHPVAAAR